MKKIEKIQKQLAKIQEQVNKVSFERKDTSYRRQKGYFGTKRPNLDDVIILREFARTKYLNTYICVSKSEEELAEAYKQAKAVVDAEILRLRRIEQRRYDREAPQKAIEHTDYHIAQGWHLGNYRKLFIEGNKHIYMAHPYYRHEDYNKWCAMPNTAKNRRLAHELNMKLMAAGAEADTNHIL